MGESFFPPDDNRLRSYVADVAERIFAPGRWSSNKHITLLAMNLYDAIRALDASDLPCPKALVLNQHGLPPRGVDGVPLAMSPDDARPGSIILSISLHPHTGSKLLHVDYRLPVTSPAF